MVKRKVIWTSRADSEWYEILDYYAKRNKNKIYSARLHREIQQRLKKLDFSVALPQKTTKLNVFYFTYNHISVFFSFKSNTVFVKSVSDDRRNPQMIDLLLQSID
jgi:ParE toxin of type II toxin-antitoxin system, parDE